MKSSSSLAKAEEDLHHSRRYESLQLALDLTLKKARDDVHLERAIGLGYDTTESGNAAVYQKVLHGILDSAHTEVKKRMERSFEELELEDKLLRFELAMLKERKDREAKERGLENERKDAKKVIENARQQKAVDPEALIRQRQCEELLKTVQTLETNVEGTEATVHALQDENVERTKAIEKRLAALNVQAEGVSRAADLCASAGV